MYQNDEGQDSENSYSMRAGDETWQKENATHTHTHTPGPPIPSTTAAGYTTFPGSASVPNHTPSTQPQA